MNTSERQTKLQTFTNKILFGSLPSEKSWKKSGDRVLRPTPPAPEKFLVALKIPLNRFLKTTSDLALKQISEARVDLRLIQTANFFKGGADVKAYPDTYILKNDLRRKLR